MKKILLVFLTAATAGFVMTSCGPTIKVTSDYDKSANFSQYKTFALVKPDPTKQSISQLNQNRIDNAIIAEMVKKGFKQATDDAADLMVNSVTILKDKQSVTSNTNYYGYGGYYRPYGWGGGMGASGYTTYNVQEYKDGSVIIEVVDAKTKTLVWEGIGNKEIDKPIKDPDTKIPLAIQKIMESFPPGMAAKK